MNTVELYEQVLEHKSIIIVIDNGLLKTVKTRLSNVRKRQQEKLEEFADITTRLDYTTVPFTKGEEHSSNDVKLRISLIPKGGNIQIKSLTPAGDF